MDAKQFTDVLSNPAKLQAFSVEELQQMAQQYPYSQPVQLLYTFKLSKSSEYLFNRQLGRCSILTDDRSVLFDLFERPQEIRPGVSETSEPPEQEPAEHEVDHQAEQTQVEAEEETSFEEKMEVEETPSEIPVAENKESVATELAPPAEEAKELEEPADPEMSPARPEAPLSPKERIQQILAENRRLNEEFNKSHQRPTAAETWEEPAVEEVHPSDEKPTPESLSEEVESISKESDIQKEPVTPAEKHDPGQEELESVEAEALVEAHEEDLESDYQLVDAGDGEAEADTEPVREQVFEIGKEVEAEEKPDPEPTELAAKKPDSDFFGWLQQLEDRGTTIRRADAAADDQKDSFEEKVQLLDSFVERLPQLKKKKPQVQRAAASAVEVGKLRDTSEDDSLVTETLAKVYLKQQHYRKAIKAYEILKLKYPEKSSLFADQISEIKKLINSK